MVTLKSVFEIDIEYELSKLGITKGKRLENMLANEVLRLSEPYTPFDIAGKYENPHQLIDSGHIENGNETVWRTPYARYLYYHPEFNFQGAPLRGGYWVDRMMQNGGKQVLQDEIKAYCKKYGGM